MFVLLAISLFSHAAVALGPEEDLRAAVEIIGALTPEELAAKLAANPNWFRETFPALSSKSGSISHRRDVASLENVILFVQGKKQVLNAEGERVAVVFEPNVPLKQQRRFGDFAVFNLINEHAMTSAEATAFQRWYEDRGLDFRRFENALEHWARSQQNGIGSPLQGLRTHAGEWYTTQENLHSSRYKALRDFEILVSSRGSEQILDVARAEVQSVGPYRQDFENWLRRFEVEVAQLRNQIPEKNGERAGVGWFLEVSKKVQSTNLFFQKAALAPLALEVARELAKYRATKWGTLYPFLVSPAEILPLFQQMRQAAPFLAEALTAEEVNPGLLILLSKRPDLLRDLAEVVREIDSGHKLSLFERNIKSKLGSHWTFALSDQVRKRRGNFEPSNWELLRAAFIRFCDRYLR